MSNVLSTEKLSIYRTVSLNLGSQYYWCISLPRAIQASLNFFYMSFERLYYSEKEDRVQQCWTIKQRLAQNNMTALRLYVIPQALILSLFWKVARGQTSSKRTNKTATFSSLTEWKSTPIVFRAHFLQRTPTFYQFPQEWKKNLSILDRKIIHHFWMIHSSFSAFFLDFLATMPCFANQSLLESIGLTMN